MSAVLVHAQRHLRHALRAPTPWIMVFIAPLCFLFAVLNLFGAMVRTFTGVFDQDHGVLLVLFSWPFCMVLSGSAEIYREKKRGLHERIRILPARYITAPLGRAAQQTLSILVMMVTVVSVATVTTGSRLILDHAPALVGVGCLVAVCAGCLGTALAYSVKTVQGAVAIVPLVMVAMFVNTLLMPEQVYSPGLRVFARNAPMSAAGRTVLSSGDSWWLTLAWFGGLTVLSLASMWWHTRDDARRHHKRRPPHLEANPEITVGQLTARLRRPLRNVVLLSLGSALLSVASILVIIDVSRHGAGQGGPRTWLIVAALVVTVVVKNAFDGLAGSIAHYADNDFQKDVRIASVRHLRKVPLGWLTDRGSAAVVTSVEDDVAAVHHMVGHGVHDVVVGTVVPALSIVVLFFVDWRVALVVLAPVVVVVVAMGIMLSQGSDLQSRYRLAEQEMGAAAVELVQGIDVLTCLAEDGEADRRFRARAQQLVAAWSAWSRQSSKYMALIDVVTSPVTMVLAVGILTATGGPEGVNACVAGMLLGLSLARAVMDVAMNTQEIVTGRAALVSLVEFLATPPLPQPVSPVELSRGAASMQLKRVSFGYQEAPVIRDCTVTFPAGTITALVGSSGAGKTTLARLMARFYDPDQGAVRINGVDLRDIDETELRRHIAVVTQDAHLLVASIIDNVTVGVSRVREQDVWDALRRVGLAEMISALPKGLDSVVGEDVVFSGGEGQRLNIARVLVRDAYVVILDEATASADPSSAALVQTAIDELALNRTVIVIAHRLESITAVDNIVVMDRGEVVEQGRHADLVSAGGLYSRLWRSNREGAHLAIDNERGMR